MNKRQKLNQSGIAHLAIIVAVVVVGVIGFVGYKVMTGGKDKNSSDATVQNGQSILKNPGTSGGNTNTNTNSGITWTYDNVNWVSSSTPPDCPSPLLKSPVNVSTVTAVLYPGQTRGQYKAHGGFHFRNNATNAVDVRMPIGGRITGAVRYYEDIAGPSEIQYLVSFENECGISIKFDHLRTLSPEVQAIMDKQPEAKANDTGGLPINNGAYFKEGALVATEVGRKSNVSVGMDFGVYDYRQKNVASKNPAYAEAHKVAGYTDFYANCWLDSFAPDVNATLKALPGGDGKAGKTSDYCTQ